MRAINWVRQQANVIPILGARTVAQMDDNLGCLDFTLSEKEMGQISDFKIGFPLSFLTSDNVRGLIFDDTFPYIDNHRVIDRIS